MPRRNKSKRASATAARNAPLKQRAQPTKVLDANASMFVQYNSGGKHLAPKVTRAPVHSRLGLGGVRVTGSQQLGDISGFTTGSAVTTGTYNLGVPMTNALSSAKQGWAISPTAMGGPLRLEGYRFTKFVFRKLIFRYRPTAAATTAGNLAFAFSPDPYVLSDLSTSLGSIFAAIKSIGESQDTSVRMPCDLVYEYKGDQLYYCDSFDSQTATNPSGAPINYGLMALARQQQQGVLIACLDSNYSVQTSLGYMDVEYVVDFYEPKNASYNQWLFSLPPTLERKILHYVCEDLIPYLSGLPQKEREEFLSKTSKRNPLRLLGLPEHHLHGGEVPEVLQAFSPASEEKSNDSASRAAAGGGWTFVRGV